MQDRIFHFRDSLLDYVKEQISKLEVPRADWLNLQLTQPTPGNLFPLRLCNTRPFRPALVTDNDLIPAIFISYDGGRKEPFEQTLIQNIVEVLGICLLYTSPSPRD